MDNEMILAKVLKFLEMFLKRYDNWMIYIMTGIKLRTTPLTNKEREGEEDIKN